jgi:signal transduction histidine kinase
MESVGTKPKLRVLLVDDHVVMRRSLRETIELTDGFEVVDEASSGSEAVAKVHELQPHLVLMDIKMPDMDGVAATRLIKSRYPEISVLALTAFGQMSWVSKMLEAGASGYLLKGGSTEDLIRSLNAVAEGGGALDAEVTTTVIEDLSRLYRKEQERAAALEDLDRMKSEFMSIISHELRTPVTVISAGVKTLRTRREKLDNETADSFLQTIEAQSDKLAQLIERILTVSMLHADELDFDSDRVRIDHVVSQIVDEIEPKLRKRIDLELRSCEGIGDPAKLRDIGSWIIDNALKYTKGRVRVSTSVESGLAKITVEDEGPGLTKETLDLVLSQPFLQGNSTNTREVGGLGLSIYLASRVLAAIGGRLEAASDPSEGSVFSIALQPAEPNEPDPATPAPSSWSGSVLLWK